jgi:hypothetical protein
MKRTYWYAAMTKDEVQHGRMTFYEAVNFINIKLITYPQYFIKLPAAGSFIPEFRKFISVPDDENLGTSGSHSSTRGSILWLVFIDIQAWLPYTHFQ